VNTSPPEHDELYEAKASIPLSDEVTPCRCAERRAAEGIDPTLLKMRVKRVRQAAEALEKVKHTLATYVSGHAPAHCEHVYGNGEPCDRAVDGFILLSCGHHAFLCAHHGSVTLRAVQGGSIECAKTEPDLHPIPARGGMIEWMSLA